MTCTETLVDVPSSTSQVARRICISLNGLGAGGIGGGLAIALLGQGQWA
jgi:hypothetical protein